MSALLYKYHKTSRLSLSFQLTDLLPLIIHINKCSFLSTDNGEVTIKRHKYYTQVTSQIQLSQSSQGYFIVWTTKDSFIQIVGKTEAFWEKLSINLNFFSKDLLQQGCWQSIHCNLVVLVKKYY